jgi:hypothetical protein
MSRGASGAVPDTGGAAARSPGSSGPASDGSAGDGSRRRGRSGTGRQHPTDGGAWRLVTAIAGAYPWSVETTADCHRALEFLDAPTSAADVRRAGYVLAGPAALGWVVLVSLLAPGVGVALLAPTAGAFGLGVAHAVHRGPAVLAGLRRTRAIGAASGLVGRAALRMRMEPTTERAARFAARTGEGPLARSLATHVERSVGTPRSGLEGFAAEWRDWFPALDRTTALLAAAADAPSGERGRTLDRAMTAVREGTRDRMAAFVAAIRSPATAVYAVGVFLPLALVGVLPAARVAGIRVPIGGLALAYDVLLPIGLGVATVWLLTRRPVTFPPPRVGHDHPDVQDRRRLGAAVGGGGGLVAGWVAGRVVAPWASPVAGVGVAVGVALVVGYGPIRTVRQRVRAVEDGLPDALYLVGRRVMAGEAVESAVAAAGAELPGPTGSTFAAAAGVQRRLRVGLRDAFLGEYGALTDLPSARTRSAAALLALAAREGQPAGGAIVAMADQLDELARTEQAARRKLSTVTETLRHTAALFAPLVGGTTVALAARMAHHGPATAVTGDPFAVGALGQVVGAYVLLEAALLTTLATGLQRGLERSLVGYRVGVALLTATATYLAAVAVAGSLF